MRMSYPCDTLSFRITVERALTGDTFELDVPFAQTLSGLKYAIADGLNKRRPRSSGLPCVSTMPRPEYLTIMFQGKVVGSTDDGSERRVMDIGLGHGCVVQVVQHVRTMEVKVVVDYYDSISPLSKAEFSFPLEVPRNAPCAQTIKAKVIEICAGGYAAWLLGRQEVANPHLFLMNYELSWHAVVSLEDNHWLDDWADAHFNPHNVYVVDQTQCRCGTCDLDWMLFGWHCPQLWHAAWSGWSESSSGSR